LIGARRTVELMRRHQLVVPVALEQAARNGGRICAAGALRFARTFVG
jgi:hypothetical protein